MQRKAEKRPKWRAWDEYRDGKAPADKPVLSLSQLTVYGGFRSFLFAAREMMKAEVDLG